MIEASNTWFGSAGDRVGSDTKERATTRLDHIIRIELGHKLQKIYSVETGPDPQIQTLIAKLDALLTQSTKTE